MHRNVTLGLGFVLLLVAADVCEAGPILNRLRGLRSRQWTVATEPAETVAKTDEKTTGVEQALAVESADEKTEVVEESVVETYSPRGLARLRIFRNRRQPSTTEIEIVTTEIEIVTTTEEATKIPTVTEDTSKVEQATAIEPIEEETTETVEASAEPTRERRFQRRRFSRLRFTRLRNLRRR